MLSSVEENATDVASQNQESETFYDSLKLQLQTSGLTEGIPGVIAGSEAVYKAGANVYNAYQKGKALIPRVSEALKTGVAETEKFTADITNLGQRGLATAQQGLTDLKTIAQTTVQNTRTAADAVVDSATQGGADLLATGEGALRSAASVASEGINSTAATVQGGLSSVVDTARTSAAELVSGVQGGAERLATATTDAGGNLLDAATGRFLTPSGRLAPPPPSTPAAAPSTSNIVTPEEARSPMTDDLYNRIMTRLGPVSEPTAAPLAETEAPITDTLSVFRNIPAVGNLTPEGYGLPSSTGFSAPPIDPQNIIVPDIVPAGSGTGLTPLPPAPETVFPTSEDAARLLSGTGNDISTAGRELSSFGGAATETAERSVADFAAAVNPRGGGLFSSISNRVKNIFGNGGQGATTTVPTTQFNALPAAASTEANQIVSNAGAGAERTAGAASSAVSDTVSAGSQAAARTIGAASSGVETTMNAATGAARNVGAAVENVGSQLTTGASTALDSAAATGGALTDLATEGAGRAVGFLSALGDVAIPVLGEVALAGTAIYGAVQGIEDLFKASSSTAPTPAAVPTIANVSQSFQSGI
jgi:hypothetical protein